MSESTGRKSSYSDQYLNQVTESIKDVFELSTRIDERVQILIKRQNDLEAKLDVSSNQSNIFTSKISILESSVKIYDNNSTAVIKDIEELQEGIHDLELKIQELEGSTSRQNDRWKGIMSFVTQLIWAVLAAFILIKLGLQKAS